MEVLTFPRYSPDDIVAYLRSHVLAGAEARSLTKADLFATLKPEVLHMIFIRILQKVYGIRLEHFYMMPVNVDIVYPQIFEGFLPVCNLYIHMERFLPVCRINDFQIADVINPKAKRTARFLSGILNFVHFRECRREAYLELQLNYKTAMEKHQQLETANQELEMKLEKLNTVPVEQQAEFKQLSDDIQELEQLLSHDYRRKTAALQELISQKKSDITERTRKLNELKVTMATLKEEQEQLKSKIVESPEELKNYKELMKETVKKLKRSKQEVIEKYEGYRDLVEGLPSCQLEVQLYQKKMERQAANVERLASVLSEVRNLEDQLESAQIELKKGKTDEMSLKRLVTAKHERLSTAEIRIKKKREDVEQYKHTVFEYFNRVQEKRGAVYDKVTAIQKEIQQTRFKIQQLNENAEKEEMKAKVGLDHERSSSAVCCWQLADLQVYPCALLREIPSVSGRRRLVQGAATAFGEWKTTERTGMVYENQPNHLFKHLGPWVTFQALLLHHFRSPPSPWGWLCLEAEEACGVAKSVAADLSLEFPKRRGEGSF